MAQRVRGRLRPRIFLTFRYYKGGRPSVKGTGRLYPSRNPWYYFQRLSRPQGTWFCRGVPRKKSPVTPPGIDPGTVRLVAQRLNHYGTPGNKNNVNLWSYFAVYSWSKNDFEFITKKESKKRISFWSVVYLRTFFHLRNFYIVNYT